MKKSFCVISVIFLSLLLLLPSQVLASAYSYDIIGEFSDGVINREYWESVHANRNNNFYYITEGKLPASLEMLFTGTPSTSSAQYNMTVHGTPAKIGEFTFTVEAHCVINGETLVATKEFTIKITDVSGNIPTDTPSNGDSGSGTGLSPTIRISRTATITVIPAEAVVAAVL